MDSFDAGGTSVRVIDRGLVSWLFHVYTFVLQKFFVSYFYTLTIKNFQKNKKKSELAKLTRITLIFTKYLYEFIVFSFITKIYS